jgi:lipoprotein-releasing system permease protein
VPVVDNYGLLDIRGYGMDMVHVLGYPPDIGKVIEWPTLLHRQGAAAAAGTPPSFGLLPDVPYERQFERGSAAAQAARTHPGMIVTGPVVGMSHGQKRAEANIRRNMVELPASLTLLPVPLGEAVQSSSAVTVGFWIVDDAKSRVYTLDAQNVYVDFDELQRDLHMAGNPADASEPARCSKILVKAKPGTDLKALTDAVDRAAQAAVLAEDYDAVRSFRVKSWEDEQGPFIKAVQSEVVITTGLFSVMSLVAVLLIFCIFYMIVVEKTKDIGIIKSVGATGGGIMALFLGYGLAIGVVGSALGVALSFAIVRNINELHAWLGREMGVQIWSPETYQFDSIPSKMKLSTVAWTVGVALLSAVLGALIPAVRAAGMNPVDSLRYE